MERSETCKSVDAATISDSGNRLGSRHEPHFRHGECIEEFGDVYVVCGGYALCGRGDCTSAWDNEILRR